jgi:tetratricopeptide (TPR) repeat protein
VNQHAKAIHVASLLSGALLEYFDWQAVNYFAIPFLLAAGATIVWLVMFGRAAELLPDDARVHDNVALALERPERSDAAESSLRNAMRLAPNDPDVLYALALHYLNLRRLDEAEALGKQFVERHPERSEGGQLLERITRQKEAKE